MNYRCPTCDEEARVGQPCARCQREAQAKKRVIREKKPRSWEQDELYDGLDLPEDDFPGDAGRDREGRSSPHRVAGIAWYWYAVALLLLVMMVGRVILFR